MPKGDQNQTLAADHFSLDTLDFIRLLARHEVKYLVVGAEAVIFHSHPRFTGDVDFFYGSDEENTRLLFEALKEFWGGQIPEVESPSELSEPGLILQFGRPPNRIDLLTRIDGVGFEEAWNTRLTLTIADGSEAVPLYMLSLSKLIQNKRAAGRPKDLEDLRFLERAAGSQDSIEESE